MAYGTRRVQYIEQKRRHIALKAVVAANPRRHIIMPPRSDQLGVFPYVSPFQPRKYLGWRVPCTSVPIPVEE